MNMIELKNLQCISYEDCEKDALVDVNEVFIDIKKDRIERLEKFINDVKSPYLVKCGNTIVQVSFSDNNKSLEEQIAHYLKSLITSGLSY